MKSVAEFFEKFEKRAAENNDAATAPNAIYQFKITGDGGGDYYLDLTKGKTGDFVGRGAHNGPGATITVSPSCSKSVWRLLYEESRNGKLYRQRFRQALELS